MDSKGALQELKQYQSTSKSAGDYYKQSQDELGVGGARAEQQQMRDLIRGTQQQLEGVGQSVAGRTRGNLVTEAQRARLQSLEERPLAERLGKQQTQYGDVSTNYRDLLSQAGTQAGMAYQSQADKEAALQRQYETLFGRERAAEETRQREIENERWRKQFEESRRQFDAQRKDAARQAADLRASIASFTTPKPIEPVNKPSLQDIFGGVNGLLKVVQAPFLNILQPAKPKAPIQGSNLRLQGGGIPIQGGVTRLQG